jgi:hypothetical protein
MHVRRRIAFGVLLAFTAGLAYAADQAILGNTLTVKNPSTPDKREITGKATEKHSPNTLVGNPVAGTGGTLTLTANGGTPTAQIFLLPQGTSAITGKPFWSGDSIKGFKYNDPKGENSAVKSAQIKKSAGGTFSIKAAVSGKIGAVLVTPPNPGTSGCVLLGLNGGDTYSVAFLFGDGIVTNKGSTLYQHKKVTFQGSCVPPPPPTTTTLLSTTTTSSTPTTTLSGSPNPAFIDHFFVRLD